MNPSSSTPAPAGKDSNTLITVSEVAEQVGREILESRLEPGAWATALYECKGRKQDALALYTRLRIRQLSKQRRVRLAKVRSFESRRLLICMGSQTTRDSLAKTIQEMLGHTKSRGSSANFMRPRLSIVWLSVLFFGTAGTVATLGRLVANRFPEFALEPIMLVALLTGVASVWCAMVVRRFLPKRWIMLGWNRGLVVTCNILCLSSLLLGTKVINQTMAADTPGLVPQKVASAPVRVRPMKHPDIKETYLVSAPAAKRSGKN